MKINKKCVFLQKYIHNLCAGTTEFSSYLYISLIIKWNDLMFLTEADLFPLKKLLDWSQFDFEFWEVTKKRMKHNNTISKNKGLWSYYSSTYHWSHFDFSWLNKQSNHYVIFWLFIFYAIISKAMDSIQNLTVSPHGKQHLTWNSSYSFLYFNCPLATTLQQEIIFLWTNFEQDHPDSDEIMRRRCFKKL